MERPQQQEDGGLGHHRRIASVLECAGPAKGLFHQDTRHEIPRGSGLETCLTPNHPGHYQATNRLLQ
jgi:hypothetical protein